MDDLGGAALALLIRGDLNRRKSALVAVSYGEERRRTRLGQSRVPLHKVDPSDKEGFAKGLGKELLKIFDRERGGQIRRIRDERVRRGRVKRVAPAPTVPAHVGKEGPGVLLLGRRIGGQRGMPAEHPCPRQRAE